MGTDYKDGRGWLYDKNGNVMFELKNIREINLRSDDGAFASVGTDQRAMNTREIENCINGGVNGSSKYA